MWVLSLFCSRFAFDRSDKLGVNRDSDVFVERLTGRQSHNSVVFCELKLRKAAELILTLNPVCIFEEFGVVLEFRLPIAVVDGRFVP